MQFILQERCGLKDEKGKCPHKLMVARVKNAKWMQDDGGFGGQLNYDEKDVRQIKYCPVHGPFNWPSNW